MQWDALVDFVPPNEHRRVLVFDVRAGQQGRPGACYEATGKDPATVEALFRSVQPGTQDLFQRQARSTGFSTDDQHRWCFIKLLEYNKVGCHVSQIPRLLHVPESVWYDKCVPLVHAMYPLLNALRPDQRFDPWNHVPMLPRCVTGIVDTLPKIVHASSLKNPKYGYKCGKASVVCTFNGTVIDYQGLAYGNRADMSFIDLHRDAMRMRDWEYLLGDKAYETNPHCLTQYPLRRGLNAAEV